MENRSEQIAQGIRQRLGVPEPTEEQRRERAERYQKQRLKDAGQICGKCERALEADEPVWRCRETFSRPGIFGGWDSGFYVISNL